MRKVVIAVCSVKSTRSIVEAIACHAPTARAEAAGVDRELLDSQTYARSRPELVKLYRA